MIHHFPGQKPDEVVKYVVRKHWIIYLKLGIFFVMAAGIPFGGYLMLQFGSDFLELTANAKRWATLIFLMYVELIMLITFIRWLEDELDIIIVTNERVISIDQVSFLHRTISETELSQIQDVKHVAKGLLANVLGFGSLEVQTAAQKIVFEIKDVEKPYEMARCIMDLCHAYKEKFAQEHHGQLPSAPGVTTG